MKPETLPTERNYENLANAIICQAVADWRSGKEYEQKDVERFFHSWFFHALTTIDPDYILQKLRTEQYHRRNVHTIHR